MNLMSAESAAVLSDSVSSLPGKPLYSASKSTSVYSPINIKNEWRIRTKVEIMRGSERTWDTMRRALVQWTSTGPVCRRMRERKWCNCTSEVGLSILMTFQQPGFSVTCHIWAAINPEHSGLNRRESSELIFDHIKLNGFCFEFFDRVSCSLYIFVLQKWERKCPSMHKADFSYKTRRILHW